MQPSRLVTCPWWRTDVEVRERHVGDLVLPSGALIACDPLVFLGRARPFVPSLRPGTYPVALGLLEGEVAYARLDLDDPTGGVHWQPARCEGEPFDDSPRGHSVDSGTSCFVDAATAAAYLAEETNEFDAITEELTRRDLLNAGSAAWHAAWQELEQSRGFRDLLTRLRQAGYQERDVAAVVTIGDGPGNVVAFSSGVGDGSYATHLGVDARGRTVCVLTDFGLLLREGDDDVEPESADVDALESADDAVARRLAVKLIDGGHIEVRSREGFTSALANFLGDNADPAAVFCDWLVDRDEVSEVFADDDILVGLLRDHAR
jgi:hypothetical protein